MLIWINGAFGSGKTQTAFELHRRSPGSHLADPELIGFAIHRMLPAHARNDFQNRPQWRSAVVATLADAGVPVSHFALQASPATLERRLRTRSAYWIGRAVGRPETWALQQIPRCVPALATARFAEHIDTDDRPIDDVVEDIAAQAGLALSPPRLSGARYQLRRAVVGVRHLRL